MTKIKKTLKIIIKTIIDNPKLKEKFYFKTTNRKYPIKQLLTHILFILKSGISYRMFNDFIENKYNISNIPHWGTLYKFYMKLIKYNVIQESFDETVKKYMEKSNNNIFMTDTTLIANKGGYNPKYNPQLKKHKSYSPKGTYTPFQGYKISSINDNNGKPINIKLYDGNINDSKILNLQLDDNINTFTRTQSVHVVPLGTKKNNNNILLADSGYDSSIIRDKLKTMNFGRIICHSPSGVYVPEGNYKNKRNCKNLELLQKYSRRRICPKGL